METAWQIISRCVPGDSWPAIDDRKIREARRLYDAGTHEMTTGRRGGKLCLLLKKRKEPAEPRRYFA